jgi:hypothetical protein
MFHTVMSLLSSFKIGVRIKQVVERAIRKTVVIALAVVVLLMAAAFALIVAYHILLSIYGFTEIESAGILAAVLILIGVIALAILPLIGPKPDRRPVLAVARRGGAAAIDSGLRSAMRQVGPMTLLAVAFATGLLLSRR